MWVPSGSGPSSFHRQKLIEAKSALKMLKGSAKQRKTSGVNKERSVVKPRPQSESWPIAVPQSMSPRSSSPTMTAAKMVPIPASNANRLGSESNVDDGHSGGVESGNDGDSSDSDSIADPELARIRKGVRILQSSGTYPSIDNLPTYDRYMQSWEPKSNSVRRPPGTLVESVKALHTPEDLSHAPSFMRRAMQAAQEAQYLMMRQASEEGRYNKMQI